MTTGGSIDDTGLGTGGPGGRIVVGVDGSLPSRAALRWAVRQAKLTGAVVDAYTAWEMPVSYSWVQGPVTGIEDFEDAAWRTLAEAIRETGAAQAGVEIRPWVQEGHPAQVLVAAAQGARLLVVGSRGHGEFAAALLGSVSQNCVHHAPCPVVVVRGHEADQSKAA